MDTPRVRARQLFSTFLPSPFTFTPYNLINSWLQVKAKTIFAFTLRDLRFLAQRGREIPNENAEKQWTLIKNVPTFVPKPTTIQLTPAQRWRQRWTQTFTFAFTASIWFTVPYASRWRVKAKNEKLRCAHAPSRARKCTFRQHPTAFSRNASPPGHHLPTQADDLLRFTHYDEAGQIVFGCHRHWGTGGSGQVDERHFSDQVQTFRHAL